VIIRVCKGTKKIIKIIRVVKNHFLKSFGLHHQGNCHLAKSEMDSVRTGCKLKIVNMRKELLLPILCFNVCCSGDGKTSK